MIGSAPDWARRKPSHDSANDEVRHGDSVVKNTKTSADDAFTEKRKKKEYHGKRKKKEYHGNDRDIWNDGQRMKMSKVPASLCEKGREKDDLNKTNSKKKMMSVDLHKKKMIISNGYGKAEGKEKVNTASLEMERKKKLLNASTWKNMQRDDGEEGRIMSNFDSKVKSRKVSTQLSAKEKNKEKLNKTHTEKKMQAADSKMRNYDSGVNKWKVSATLSEEKNKEKLNKTHREKKMQAAGSKMRNYDSGVNKWKVSATFSEKEKNKEKLNKTHREKKMQAADSKMRNYDSGVNKGKVCKAFCEKEKKRKRPNNTSTEKETAPITSAVKEKKMRTTESMEIKMRHDRQNRGNVPLDVPNEKMDTSSDSYYKIRKRKSPHTQLKKKKRMQCNDSDKNIHGAKMKDMKIFSCGKEKVNQASFAFFKVLCNNFEKFLVIPLTVAPRLEYLTNHLVYLKDSEGKCSEVMVSKVSGSLAFHQGWDIFVSNHLIKWGEFLLFEYISESTFSVRVFGTDSSERLYFNVESTTKGERKKQTWSNMSPDDLVLNNGSSENIDDGNYVSGENPRTKVPQTGHVSYNTKEDPKPVEHVVGSGIVAQDNNGNLIDPQCKTKGTSPLCSKGKTLIMLTDSEPSAHENGDTMGLATSGADSVTRLVSVNTNEDPIRAQSGIGNGPSVVLADEKGSSPEIEGRTKSISTTCNEGKTRSQISINATTLLYLHDSDEDLGIKQRTNVIPLDSITPVVDYHNHSKMNIIENFYRKYEAPGGFLCLEKWRKDVVNNQAALDCTVPIKLENSQKSDSMLVDGYGSIELNPVDEYICSEGNHEYVQPIFTMPIKEPSSADRVTNCGHDGTKIDYSINEKDEGTSVLLEAKGEQLEPMGSTVHSQSNNVPLCANPVVAGPMEKTSSPDEISRCRSSMIEIEHNVNGKGTTVQFETKMDHVDPVRSSVCSKSCNTVVCANKSDAEHRSSKQEGRMSSDCVVPVSLLPMKDEILELDYHSPPEINSQLCIPDTTQKWLVSCGYGSIELNPVGEYVCSESNHERVQPIFTMPIKEPEPSSADRITNCKHDGTEIDYSINEKDEGASVLLEAKGGQLEPMGSIVHSQSNNVKLCANPVVPGTIETTSSPDEISKCRSSMIEIGHNVNGKGTTVQLETKMDQVETVRSSVCSKICNTAVCANESEHHSSKQEGRMASNCEVPESLLPMKDEILELDYHSPPEINSQLCIPDTTQKWLDLSKSLSSAVRLRPRRHGWNVIMLKDPTKRLWPIIYHDNPVFVGFTAGWKHFVAANNLQTGDFCELIKESDVDETVYSVRMCGKI